MNKRKLPLMLFDADVEIITNDKTILGEVGNISMSGIFVKTEENITVNTNVEIIARAEHGKVFVGTNTGQDAYQCIDMAVHKLEGQLRKAKGKERDNKHANEKGTENTELI